MKSTLASISIVALLAVLTAFSQRLVDKDKVELERERPDELVLPRSDAVKAASMGFQGIVADSYWMEAIQYFSRCVDEKKVPVNLYKRTDFITDLDPHFSIAYYFTAINLLVEGGEPEEIVQILEKGKRECKKESPFTCQNYWKIPFYLGVCYYFALGEHDKAADNMEEAAKLTGHKFHHALAGRIRSEGGKPEVAITYLKAAMAQTEDERQRAYYRRRIDELTAIKMEMDMNALREKYESKFGSPISGLSDLAKVQPGFKVPPHPLADHRFVFDAETDNIRSEPEIENKVFRALQSRTISRDGG